MGTGASRLLTLASLQLLCFAHLPSGDHAHPTPRANLGLCLALRLHGLLGGLARAHLLAVAVVILLVVPLTALARLLVRCTRLGHTAPTQQPVARQGSGPAPVRRMLLLLALARGVRPGSSSGCASLPRLLLLGVAGLPPRPCVRRVAPLQAAPPAPATPQPPPQAPSPWPFLPQQVYRPLVSVLVHWPADKVRGSALLPPKQTHRRTGRSRCKSTRSLARSRQQPSTQERARDSPGHEPLQTHCVFWPLFWMQQWALSCTRVSERMPPHNHDTYGAAARGGGRAARGAAGGVAAGLARGAGVGRALGVGEGHEEQSEQQLHHSESPAPCGKGQRARKNPRKTNTGIERAHHVRKGSEAGRHASGGSSSSGKAKGGKKDFSRKKRPANGAASEQRSTRHAARQRLRPVVCGATRAAARRAGRAKRCNAAAHKRTVLPSEQTWRETHLAAQNVRFFACVRNRNQRQPHSLLLRLVKCRRNSDNTARWSDGQDGVCTTWLLTSSTRPLRSW